MVRSIARVVLWSVLAGAVALTVWLGPALAFHVLAPSWTGEPDRLVSALGIGPGSTVAEIGAGSGWLAVELAARIGPSGRVYASEITPEKRDAIAALAARRGAANVQVVEAGERSTGLPDGCCDAIVLRNVLHHIDEWPGYAAALRVALKPDGRIGIIDFAPGAFFHLSGDHGAAPDDVVAAFAAAGLTPVAHHDDWGGRMYLIVFERASSNRGRPDPHPALPPGNRVPRGPVRSAE